MHLQSCSLQEHEYFTKRDKYLERWSLVDDADEVAGDGVSPYVEGVVLDDEADCGGAWREGSFFN